METNSLRILVTLNQRYDRNAYDYFLPLNPRQRPTVIRLLLEDYLTKNSIAPLLSMPTDQASSDKADLQLQIRVTLNPTYDQKLYDYFMSVNPKTRTTLLRTFLDASLANQHPVLSNPEAQNKNQSPIIIDQSVLDALKTTLKLETNKEIPKSDEVQASPKADVAKEIPKLKVAKEESAGLKYLGEHMDDLLNSIKPRK